MRTIIFPPLLDWDWMTQRPQQLMKQFARHGCRVYYCNRTVQKGAKVMAWPGEPGLYIVKDHEQWLCQDYARVRAEADELLLWCGWPGMASRLHRYEADRIVYDCADDFPQWYPQEEAMARAADGIVCSSARLDRRLASRYPDKPRLLLRNGYDEDMGLHLSAARSHTPPRPTDLPQTGRPLVGYIGAWAPWVDAGLLASIAGRRGVGAEVVIIGAMLGRRCELADMAGVHYLGLRPHGQLSAYLAHLDVCLVPFLPQPATLAANPVKVYEYLAAGKPVVSTDLPECREMGEMVEIGADRSAVLAHIRHRLETPGDASARRRYALGNSWRLRARACLQWLDQLRRGERTV